MGKLKDNWNKKLWYEKIVFVIGMVTAVSVILLALLQLFNVWENSGYVYMPMSALLMLVQAFDNRKRSRKLMISSLCVAAFIGIVWILVLFGL